MIGVFDSGLGGLTVLKALIEQLPGQSFVYLGDTARLPYGTKSAQTIRKYTEQNLKFLKNQNVTAIVIACNSASAQWKDDTFEGLPVFTVIEPTSLAALKKTVSKKIGLLATRATVNSMAFDEALKNLDSEVQLFSQAAPLLVPFAEEGLQQDPLTNLIVYRYVQPLLAQGIDTLILGCTHYPILKESLQKVVGLDVELIESGHAVAEKLKAHFPPDEKKQGGVKIFTTDAIGHFKKWATQILLPHEAQSWELIDLN
jgi:glutamate racemase